MKNKFILYICIIIALTGIVSAQTYEQLSVVDVKVPFEVNGSQPSSSAICNFSVQYPNTTYIIQNDSMTYQNNGEFNYTILGEETRPIGEYEWTAFCCDTGARCAAGYGLFTITRSGLELDSGEGISLFGSLMVMILTCLIFFAISMRVKSNLWKFLLMCVSLLFLFITIMYSMVIVDNILGGFTNILANYTTFLLVIKVAVRAAILALLIFGIWAAMSFYKWKRGMLD